ncbi:hypothetical protein LDENG_00208890 [Lucifuga dentata]|nr:hypothetical protein LDENG_00208890 [Lucifuga dentata]
MSSENVAEVYAAVCTDLKLTTNPYIIEVLQKTTEQENVTLKLSGNNRLRPVQRLSDGDILALTQSLKNNTCVTGLDFGYNNISDKGAEHLANLLKQEKSALTSLDLTFNHILTDGAQVLAEELQCNSSLLCLRLSANKIGNGGGMHIASMLQVNNTLQELQLAECDLGSQSVITLIVVLKSNTSLRSVDISRPLLFSQQEEWAEHCCSMLQVNNSLVELHLGKLGMTDSALERLTAGLRLNHTLRYLDLRCNRLRRDSALHLAELLQQNATLHILDLSSNCIQDEGAVNLSQALALPGCSLRELSVSHNSIGTEGLLTLAQAMKVNGTLTHIYIWGNQLEEPVCLAFSQLMSSGRLPAEQTDVSVYQVDGQVFLTEVSNRLRTHYYRMDTSPASNATPMLTADTPTNPIVSPDSAFLPQVTKQSADELIKI